MFIDIHVHVRKLPCAPRGGRRPFSTPEELIARYDELEIERGVLLPLVSPEFYEPQSNHEILEVAAQFPGRFIPFCNVDPRMLSNSPEAALDETLGYYRDLGCKGVGEVTANLPWPDPMVQNLLAHAEKLGMPLTFHIGSRAGGVYGLVDEPGLPGLSAALERFGDLKFLGHSTSFWAEIGPLERPEDRDSYPDYSFAEEGVVPGLFRRFPNLYGDLSAGSGYNALARNPAYAAEFLDEFQDRLLFGTDICAPGTKTPLVGLLLEMRDSKKITGEVFDKVARENAAGLLGLD